MITFFFKSNEMQKFSILSFCLFYLLACATEPAGPQPGELNGKWYITEAKRNGKMTQTFSNAYFIFHENGQLETNYTGEIVQTTYKLDGQSIVQGGDMPMNYTLSEWADSSVLMNFEMQQFKFEFLLKRESENPAE